MACTAKMRPFRPINETEVTCEKVHDTHDTTHTAVLRDYAYQGSETKMEWQESDRRTFHGAFEECGRGRCILPKHHRGDHV